MSRNPLLALAVTRGLVATPASGSDAEAILRAAGVDEAQIAELRQELERSAVPPPIPGYRLIELIGTGAHSQVWRARQEAVEREVAVKIIPARRQRDIERFLREARAAGAIGSPYVVTCHEAGQAGDALFLVMELMREGDAEALAEAQGGRLPEQRALEIVRDAARGLSALFSAGLTHRDIKPANILLSGSGAKLADLGLARDAEAPLHRTAQSSMGEGTPAFMSPEQVRGEQLDVRSDLFSLGTTFYRLATGALPYPGRTVVETLHLLDQGPSPDPIDTAPDLSHGSRLMIQVAMSRSRGLRYQHPDQFAEDAASVLHGRPPLHARRLRQQAYDSHLDQRPARPTTTAIRPWQLLAALLATLMFAVLAGRGLGGPSAEESTAITQARAAGDATGWRRYLDGYPHGYGQEEAEAQLALLAEVERATPAAERAQQESANLRVEIARLKASPERGAAGAAAHPAAIQPAADDPRQAALRQPAPAPPGAGSQPAPPVPPPPSPVAAIAPPPAPSQPFTLTRVPPSPATRPEPAAPPMGPSGAADAEAVLKAHVRRFPLARIENLAGLSCHPADPSIMLAWNVHGDVWRTSDGATTWLPLTTAANSGSSSIVRSNAYWAAKAKMVFIPCETIQNIGFLSEDGGKSFHLLPKPVPPDDTLLHRVRYVTMFDRVLLADGELFVAAQIGYESGTIHAVLSSDDRGRSWRNRMTCSTMIDALYPTEVGVLVIAGEESGIFGGRVSADLGKTWTNFAPTNAQGLRRMGLPHWLTRDKVVVVDASAIIPTLFSFSIDGLVAEATQILPSTAPLRLHVDAIAIDPLDPRIWYLAGPGSGLLRSLDLGKTWMGFAFAVVDPAAGHPSLSFTAGTAPRLVLSTPTEAIVIDDHLHEAALFPMPLRDVIAGKLDLHP